MVHFKESVETQWPIPLPTKFAIDVAEEIYAAQQTDLWITSMMDSHKKWPKSLHHAGLAFDCRVWNLPPGTARGVAKQIAARLGTSFDVVFETDHIHIEYDPDEPIREGVTA